MVWASESTLRSAVQQPHDERCQHAKKQAGCQGKEDGRVPAAPDDIARKASERQMEALQQHGHPATEHKEQTEDDENASQTHGAPSSLSNSLSLAVSERSVIQKPASNSLQARHRFPSEFEPGLARTFAIRKSSLCPRFPIYVPRIPMLFLVVSAEWLGL